MLNPASIWASWTTNRTKAICDILLKVHIGIMSGHVTLTQQRLELPIAHLCQKPSLPKGKHLASI